MNKKQRKKQLLYILTVFAAFVLLFVGYAGYVYASTPEHLRRPAFQHYHFRTQILVNGRAVNFADKKFQQAYDKGSCTTDLASAPIHFHDNVDQMTHIHWDGMTGGEFIKYYGWNFIGGQEDSLGYRYDQGVVSPSKIPIAGEFLPQLPSITSFFVYTGDANGYERKDWNDFLRQDLEAFFGKQSSVPPPEESTFNLGNWLFPKVSAHSEVDDGHDAKDEAELTRINNLIGNVVIFVQEQEPSEGQIKERFNKLVPLQDSTCGG
jgi:hypothetical protein